MVEASGQNNCTIYHMPSWPAATNLFFRHLIHSFLFQTLESNMICVSPDATRIFFCPGITLVLPPGTDNCYIAIKTSLGYDDVPLIYPTLSFCSIKCGQIIHVLNSVLNVYFLDALGPFSVQDVRVLPGFKDRPSRVKVPGA